MRNNIIFLLIFIFSELNYGQFDISYDISSELFIDSKIITINQDISLVNNTSVEIDTLYLNDWSNSYSSSDSQLALKFAEKFNRSFYYSSKNKKGNTNIQEIYSGNKYLKWERLPNQNDIIMVILNKSLIPKEKFILSLKYSISIPDISFSGGYGIKKDKYINIKDFIISLSRFENNKWFYQSNLDLNDNSQNKSNYDIKWIYPKYFFLYSSINHIKTIESDTSKIGNYSGQRESSPHFIFSLNNDLRKFEINNNRTEQSSYC